MPTTIEWTNETWNPVTGCTKITPGCDHCYAARFAERFRGVLGSAYEQGFDLKLWPERLTQPERWKKPRSVFVNSMSDLFHKDIPDAYVTRVFQAMHETPRHTYQVLTKRSSLMRRYVAEHYPNAPVPPYIWLGVSVENRAAKSRIEHLRGTNAAMRFLSVEPLLESLGAINLDGIDWVIVGGESGPGFRPLQADWVREVRDQCIAAGVALFFKQWGGLRPKAGGNELDGRAWQEYPTNIEGAA